MRRGQAGELSTLVAWEIRRLWRGVMPWLLALAVPAVSALVGRWQAPALERHLEHLSFLSLLSVAFSALAAWTAQRDRRTGSDEIVLAWPVASWRLGLARTLALGSITLVAWLEATLVSLGHTVVSYATAAQAAGVPFPLAGALRDGGLIALSLAASFLGAQALGQAAATVLPGLAALVALVLFRAFAVVGPRLLLGTLQWPYALLASPEFLWEGRPRLVEGLYTNVYTGLFLAHQAFWAIGSLGLLAALALRFEAQRDGPRASSGPLALCALLVSLGSALPFVSIERRYVTSHQRAVATYGGAVKAPLHLGDGPFMPQGRSGPASSHLVRYDLAVDLTRPPEVSVRATVELAAEAGAPLDSLVFTLRRAFEIDGVRVEGDPVAPERLEREGDLLRIRLGAIPAGGSYTVSVDYHGRVEDWRLDPYETPMALNSRDLVFLPAGWGWYPVPGEHRLTWEIGMSSLVFRALADRTQPFNDAEPAFDVVVQALPGMRYLIGFTPEGGGRWRLRGSRNQVSLVGGPWWAREQGQVRYAIPFEELDSWQEPRGDPWRLLAAAADWTGVAPITVLPSVGPLIHTGDPSLFDARPLWRVYEQGVTRERLILSARRWLNDLLRFQPQSGPAGSPTLDERLGALQAYLLQQVFDEAFGSHPGLQAIQSTEAHGQMALVEAWAGRTSRAEQKEALRRLFRVAYLRPVTPLDLAFLDRGGQP